MSQEDRFFQLIQSAKIIDQFVTELRKSEHMRQCLFETDKLELAKAIQMCQGIEATAADLQTWSKGKNSSPKVVERTAVPRWSKEQQSQGGRKNSSPKVVERTAVPRICEEYRDLFSGIGCLPGEYDIELDNSIPHIKKLVDTGNCGNRMVTSACHHVQLTHAVYNGSDNLKHNSLRDISWPGALLSGELQITTARERCHKDTRGSVIYFVVAILAEVFSQVLQSAVQPLHQELSSSKDLE
ncbi:hypothetical protein EMCRGX_G020441 [Ephydatia muelleri]